MESTNFIVQLNRDRPIERNVKLHFSESSHVSYNRIMNFIGIFYPAIWFIANEGAAWKNITKRRRRSSATGQAVLTLRPNYAAALLPRIMEKFIADKLS